MLKKLMIHTRKGIKMIILLLISIFIILGILAFLYKPTYSVYIAGEQVGYTENRASLQQKINDFVNHGDGNEKNVAFVQVENLPQYKMCLLKKDIVTNDLFKGQTYITVKDGQYLDIDRCNIVSVQ